MNEVWLCLGWKKEKIRLIGFGSRREIAEVNLLNVEPEDVITLEVKRNRDESQKKLVEWMVNKGLNVGEIVDVCIKMRDAFEEIGRNAEVRAASRLPFEELRS